MFAIQLIVIGPAILIGGSRAMRLRYAVDVAYLMLALLYACANRTAFQYPKDLIREIALVLLLLPFVLAARTSPDAPP